MNPALVRHVLFPLHERLKRKPTFRWLRELERTQWLDRKELAEYQLGRLRQLLEFGYRHVPYYREVMDERGLAPHRFESFDDLQRLPFLTREMIQTRSQALRANAPLPGVHARSSGGSTGVPVTVLVDMGRMGIAEAARLRAHRWFGVEPGEREVVVWASPIELTRQDHLRQWRDRLLNSHLLSAFDMGEDRLRRYAERILRHPPAKMYGYASALYLLARYFERESLPPPPGLRAVFTTAEPLFDFQRKVIQTAFGCAVGVEYGCRDGGLVALECPEGGLHVFAEGMCLEILDPDEQGRGEIVLTNLDSHAFPIVRYRTGDIGSVDPTPCRCGRGLPKLRAVEGRRTDFLVTPSGRVLHALSAIYLLRELATIREFRIVQEAVNHLVIHLVPTRPLQPTEEGEIRAKFAVVFGPDMRVDVVQSEALPRSPSGKFRYVESKVAQPILERLMSGHSQGGLARND
ncbi:MAG TPA: phenylacetate--CoA ligase family protein [Methylomirabilota bacterium]|nr:phenylacetate--CoA ligase family protein [Methylomirabilota bacterium]